MEAGSYMPREIGGDMIAELQDRLAAAGYLTGASDGIYGGDTAAAVEQFQKTADFRYREL